MNLSKGLKARVTVEFFGNDYSEEREDLKTVFEVDELTCTQDVEFDADLLNKDPPEFKRLRYTLAINGVRNLEDISDKVQETCTAT